MEYRYSSKWLYWSTGGALLLMAFANKNWLFGGLGIGLMLLGFKRNGEDYL